MDDHGFAHEILARVIAVIGAPSTSLLDRRDAAFTVAFVATLIEPTEAEPDVNVRLVGKRVKVRVTGPDHGILPDVNLSVRMHEVNRRKK